MQDTARQQYIIGDNLRHHGMYEDAVNELQKSLHIRLHLLGPWHIDTGKSHYALGLSLKSTKDYPLALEHLSKATRAFRYTIEEIKEKHAAQVMPEKTVKLLQHLETLAMDVQLNTARTYHAMGIDQQRCKMWDSCIELHRKALAIRENVLGVDHLETARTYFVLGCALSDRGDLDEALADLRRTLRVRVKYLGEQHRDTQEVLDHMVTVLQAKLQSGHVQAAVDEEKRMEMNKPKPDEKKSKLPFRSSNATTTSSEEDELSTTSSHHSASQNQPGVLTAETIDEYRHMVVLSVQAELDGTSKNSKGDLETALQCYRRALGYEVSILGDLHPTACDLYVHIGNVIIASTKKMNDSDSINATARLKEAMEQYRSAIRIYERLVGKFHIKVATIYKKLGDILLEREEYETALSFFCKAYGIFDSTLGNHTDTIQTMDQVRRAASKLGDAPPVTDRIMQATLSEDEQDMKEGDGESEDE